MADETEIKMESLKKAYAEIILNTSKEAAAKVMVAERKALRFRQDLFSLKEESLRMLLRLKDNFNSKITEAEARSLNQKIKIEELEAQLSEAEGIIIELRDELKQVYEKLDIMRQNQEKPLDGNIRVDDADQQCVPPNNALDSSPVITSLVLDAKSVSVECEMKAESLCPTVVNKSCHANAVNSTNISTKPPLNQLHHDADDFTSIIMQNRETDLCRKGCTQRIHAFERNLSNTELSASRAEDHQTRVNVQSKIKLDEAGDSNGPTLFTEVIDNADQYHKTDLYTLTGRKKHCRKARGKLKRDCLRLLKTSRKASSVLSYCEDHPKTFHNDVEKIPNGLGELLHDSSYPPKRSAGKNARYREAIAALRRPYRRQCVKSWKQPGLCRCQCCSSGLNMQAVEILTEVVENDPKKSKVLRPSVSNDLIPSVEMKGNGIDVRPGEEWENMVSSEEVDDLQGREASSDNLCPITVDALLVDTELVDVPISEGFDSTHSERENDRLLKFTFQRKRRKNVSGKPDVNIVPDSAVKRKLEKLNDVSELENHSSKDELHGEMVDE